MASTEMRARVPLMSKSRSGSSAEKGCDTWSTGWGVVDSSKELFDKFDLDGDGRVSTDELKKVLKLRRLGDKRILSECEVVKLQEIIDAEEIYTMDLKEFQDVWCKIQFEISSSSPTEGEDDGQDDDKRINPAASIGVHSHEKGETDAALFVSGFYHHKNACLKITQNGATVKGIFFGEPEDKLFSSATAQGDIKGWKIEWTGPWRGYTSLWKKDTLQRDGRKKDVDAVALVDSFGRTWSKTPVLIEIAGAFGLNAKIINGFYRVSREKPAHNESPMWQKISVYNDIYLVRSSDGRWVVARKETVGQAIYTFEPGEMGLEYDANGIVTEVFNRNGQAFAKGVVKGDQILKVGTEVFSPDAVRRAETIGHQYEVTFKVRLVSVKFPETTMDINPDEIFEALAKNDDVRSRQKIKVSSSENQKGSIEKGSIGTVIQIDFDGAAVIVWSSHAKGLRAPLPQADWNKVEKCIKDNELLSGKYRYKSAPRMFKKCRRCRHKWGKHLNVVNVEQTEGSAKLVTFEYGGKSKTGTLNGKTLKVDGWSPGTVKSNGDVEFDDGRRWKKDDAGLEIVAQFVVDKDADGITCDPGFDLSGFMSKGEGKFAFLDPFFCCPSRYRCEKHTRLTHCRWLRECLASLLGFPAGYVFSVQKKSQAAEENITSECVLLKIDKQDFDCQSLLDKCKGKDDFTITFKSPEAAFREIDPDEKPSCTIGKTIVSTILALALLAIFAFTRVRSWFWFFIHAAIFLVPISVLVDSSGIKASKLVKVFFRDQTNGNLRMRICSFFVNVSVLVFFFALCAVNEYSSRRYTKAGDRVLLICHIIIFATYLLKLTQGVVLVHVARGVVMQGNFWESIRFLFGAVCCNCCWRNSNDTLIEVYGKNKKDLKDSQNFMALSYLSAFVIGFLVSWARISWHDEFLSRFFYWCFFLSAFFPIPLLATHFRLSHYTTTFYYKIKRRCDDLISNHNAAIEDLEPVMTEIRTAIGNFNQKHVLYLHFSLLLAVAFFVSVPLACYWTNSDLEVQKLFANGTVIWTRHPNNLSYWSNSSNFKGPNVTVKTTPVPLFIEVSTKEYNLTIRATKQPAFRDFHFQYMLLNLVDVAWVLLPVASCNEHIEHMLATMKIRNQRDFYNWDTTSDVRVSLFGLEVSRRVAYGLVGANALLVVNYINENFNIRDFVLSALKSLNSDDDDEPHENSTRV